MEPGETHIFQNYLLRLEVLHDGMRDALAGLWLEALDWVPGEGMNSLAVLAIHTAGARRYWIGDVAGGDPSGRVREREFQARGQDAAALLAMLE